MWQFGNYNERYDTPITDPRAISIIDHETPSTAFSTAPLGCDWVTLFEGVEVLEGHVKLLPSGPNKHEIWSRSVLMNRIKHNKAHTNSSKPHTLISRIPDCIIMLQQRSSKNRR
jgi:hypothetical protein